MFCFDFQKTDINYDDVILNACDSIGALIDDLVTIASILQRELQESGRVDQEVFIHCNDNQWSKGLISAAEFVGEAIDVLCETAKDLVQGRLSENRLIAAAKQVASSTTHLVVAGQVKAQANSPNVKKLQEQALLVKKATDHLVQVAHSTISNYKGEIKEKNENSSENILTKEIEMREKILEIEDKIKKKKSDHEAYLKQFKELNSVPVSLKTKEINIRTEIAVLIREKEEAEKEFRDLNTSRYITADEHHE